MSTVEAIYNAKDSDPTIHITRYLFPTNTGLAFWDGVYTEQTRIPLDRRFLMKYRSFVYFNSSDSDYLNYTRFTTDVRDHLIANAKKYDELYRIHNVDDDKYSLYDNYNMTETMDRDTTADLGQQVNGSNEDLGSRADSNSHSVAPYDSDTTHLESANAQSYGAQHNTSSATFGERHDAGTEDYTLTKVGNIGVQTVTDMLRKHKDFWTKWQFIDYIFEEISKELLLVD